VEEDLYMDKFQKIRRIYPALKAGNWMTGFCTKTGFARTFHLPTP